MRIKKEYHIVETVPKSNKKKMIFVMFGGRVFQQTVAIPMGTNCDPIFADQFLYSCAVNYIST